MNISSLVERLDQFRNIISVLLMPIRHENAVWKPADGAWSIMEIVRHLKDEEVEDFRTRVQRTLADPRQPWPPINPEQAAVDQKYNEGQLGLALAEFIAERNESLIWIETNLQSIVERASNTHEHPKFGPIQLGELFASWAAHDLLHLRQITKRLYQLTERDSNPHSLRYAGDW